MNVHVLVMHHILCTSMARVVVYCHWQVRKLEEQLTDLTDKHESTEKKQVKMKEQNAQLIERYALMTSQRASRYNLFNGS